MSLTPKEEEANIEIERRKKKVVAEELNLKSELANNQSLIIFSDIFHILRQPVSFEEHLKRRCKLRQKKRARYFLGRRLLEDELKEPEDKTPVTKPEKGKEMIHVHIYPRMISERLSKEVLDNYRKFLNK